MWSCFHVRLGFLLNQLKRIVSININLNSAFISKIEENIIIVSLCLLSQQPSVVSVNTLSTSDNIGKQLRGWDDGRAKEPDSLTIM